ncbi:translocation/assembly module TamB [Rhodonellum sp.]|uniref:translocation/assembly module TamB n=1 Tax=Rhodonellum sp. TaxID=2231180 RepID=UPI002722A6F7|nr:translocation/assembly module TamB [Rhodonellum sp.]MDO9551804.1 translocation/assembly module TamB domain-containing protein [Rhodonellum sp.]
MAILLILLVSLVFFIRSPWGQGIIVEKATSFVSKKTGAKVEIEKLFLTFRGNVYLEGLYIEDLVGDTLLYSKSLESGVAIMPLIKDGEIRISKLEWEGLVARIRRDENTEQFNFNFFIEAFSPKEGNKEVGVSVSDTPEGEENALSITLGPVSFKDFDLIYQDEVTGMDASLIIGELVLETEQLNLEKFEFYIQNLTLQDSKIHYHQTKPFLPSEVDSLEETQMPLLVVENFLMKNVELLYQNDPDNQKADVKIGSLTFQIPEADLQSQKISVKTFALNQSSILFHDFSEKTGAATAAVRVDGDPTGFSWPEWNIEIGQFDLEDNYLEYKSKDQPVRAGYFNPEAILLDQFNLSASNIFLKNQKGGLNLRKLVFTESGGFQLKEFSFKAKASDTAIHLEELSLETNRSILSGEVDLSFASLQELIEFPDRIKFDLSVDKLRADVRDAYYFDQTLAREEMIRKLAVFPFDLSLRANGDLSQIDIPKLNLSWGPKTVLNANGQITNPMDTDLLAFDFPKLNLKTDRKTIAKFVEEKNLGIRLPEDLEIQAYASGKLDDLVAFVQLDTELGQIILDGKYRDIGQLAFEADLKVKDLQLGEIIENPEIGSLTFQIQASAEGESMGTLNASLNSTFEKLNIYGRDYAGLALEGQLESGVGEVKMWLKEEFLDFELLTKLDLDTVNSKIDLTLDLVGANFFELGLSSQDLRSSFRFNAQFEGNPSSFDVKTSLENSIVIIDQRTYPLGALDLVAHVREDSTSVDIKSLMVNGKLRSNTSPQGLSEAIQRHLRQYLDEKDSVVNGTVEMRLDLVINQAPILNQVLLKGLDQLDSVKLRVDFKASENKLDADLDLPYIKYGAVEIDSLGLRVRSDQEDLNLAFGFLALESSPLSMGRTYFTGELENSRLYFDFNSFDGEEKLMHLASDIGFSGDTLSIHISPKDLLLNKEAWQIPENNLIAFSDKYLHFEEFRFFREQQELEIRDDLAEIEDDHLALVFKGFRLETFTSLLNPDQFVAGGLMDGQFIVENPFGATGLLANLKITDLKALDVALGNLSLDASSRTMGNYEVNLALKDGGIDLDLTGDFKANEEAGTFDLNLDLNKINMEVFAGLSGDEVRDGSGYISGNIKASGSTTDPIYSGDIRFNQAGFVLSQLNSKLLLSDEAIRIDNDGVYLKNFTFSDAQNNTFSIDGSVFTETYTNPSFDLKINAKNFSAINSTIKDNDLFFGKGIIDADVTVKGDLNLPVVVATLGVKSGTKLTFIVPESQLDLVERDGIVVFVNRQDPYDILTRSIEETTSGFVGYDIRARLNIDPAAEFNIVVDKNSGDNLLVSGQANLNMEINPNGRITLSGLYEINKGHYEMSLYNLVSKRFEIGQGSRITWNGDPMDADLNISAIYAVRTASSELMSSQLSGADAGSRTQYLQELPFLVFLNVNGPLLRPEISFRLDMPEDQRGAIGGNVYSRVLQVNDQEDELNKQVFSLLVLNRFFPTTGSDGSGGGTSAIARNSVSQVLSGQLNALSSNVFGKSGLELDFDLDSFTDYQSGRPQDRTQLNVSARKRLFDDRLIVQVGSQVDIEGSSQSPDQENAVLGNISLEYMLTENGRYRLRAFRRNQFESIIDGQLIVTGFGLIFNREFNRFTELWRGIDLNKDNTNPIEEIENQNRENSEGKKESKPSKKEKIKEENED